MGTKNGCSYVPTISFEKNKKNPQKRSVKTSHCGFFLTPCGVLYNPVSIFNLQLHAILNFFFRQIGCPQSMVLAKQNNFLSVLFVFCRWENNIYGIATAAFYFSYFFFSQMTFSYVPFASRAKNSPFAVIFECWIIYHVQMVKCNLI